MIAVSYLVKGKCPALPFLLGFVVGKLWVESLDWAAEPGLELYGGFVGENLVFAGFDGLHYGAYEIGRVHLGPGGMHSHRGVDIPDVDAYDVYTCRSELQAQRVGGRPEGSLGGAVDATNGIPAHCGVDVDDHRFIIRGQDRRESA